MYSEPIKEGLGDLIPVEEFKDIVSWDGFIDDDGWGLAVKDGKTQTWDLFNPDKDNRIWPSTVDLIPGDATHILWFNR